MTMLAVVFSLLFTLSPVTMVEVMTPSVENHKLPLLLYNVNNQLNQRCNYIQDLRLLVNNKDVIEEKIHTISTSRLPDRRSQAKKIKKTLDELTSATLPALEDDIEGVRRSQLQKIKRDIQRKLKEDVERLQRKLQILREEKQSMDIQQRQLTQTITRVEKRIESITEPPVKVFLRPVEKEETRTEFPLRNNGFHSSSRGITTFQWPITHWSQKKHNKEIVFSNPFDHNIGDYSYKLRMGAIFGGGGDDGYLSLYLQVMQGPDDDHLPWPIIGTYEFSIKAQSNQIANLRIQGLFGSSDFNWRKPGSVGTYSAFAPNNEPYGYHETFRHVDIENPNYLVGDKFTIICTINSSHGF